MINWPVGRRILPTTLLIKLGLYSIFDQQLKYYKNILSFDLVQEFGYPFYLSSFRDRYSRPVNNYYKERC